MKAVDLRKQCITVQLN